MGMKYKANHNGVGIDLVAVLHQGPTLNWPYEYKYGLQLHSYVTHYLF